VEFSIANSLITEQQQIMAAAEVYRNSGNLPPGVVRDVIADSWKRSRDNGVDPHMERVACTIAPEERNRRFEDARQLLEVAHAFIVNLYESTKETAVAVGLLDRDGLILEVLTEGVVKSLIDEAGLVPGHFINEESVGTFAPSLVLKTGQPQRVTSAEHWVVRASICTSVAAPIRDSSGEIAGIISVNVIYNAAEEHPHTYGMTIAAAKAIETQLRLKSTADELYRSHEYLMATIRSISDGLIILDRQLTVMEMNEHASDLTSLRVGGTLSAAMRDDDMYQKIEGITISHKGFSGEAIFFDSHGSDQRVFLDAQPILDSGDRLLGVVLVIREMKRVRSLAHKIYGARARYCFDDIVGEDDRLARCITVLKRAADSDFPIVITGESGTGKEMFAHAIHNHSHRSEGPFIPLNCAAIPKDLLESELFGYDEGAFTGAKRGGNPGKFELADGGTIFLDEIDSMPLDMQAKLLRLIEEKRVLRLGGKGFIPVDIRIISASNKDLLERIAEGAFRDDLYFRLNVVSVSLPPLRERPGDIPLLARHFIGKYTKSAGEAERLLTPEILESLQSYEWPGNARELSNWVERLLALGNDGASGVDVPVSIGETRTGEVPKSAEARRATLHEGEASYMKTLIVEAIKRNHGVMSKAASDLGISRSTLYRRIARHGIEF